MPADWMRRPLERLLFPDRPRHGKEYAQPDFPLLHQELKRKIGWPLQWYGRVPRHTWGALPTATDQSAFNTNVQRQAWRAPCVRCIERGKTIYRLQRRHAVRGDRCGDGEIRRAASVRRREGATNYTSAEATWTQSCRTGSPRTFRTLEHASCDMICWFPTI